MVALIKNVAQLLLKESKPDQNWESNSGVGVP